MIGAIFLALGLVLIFEGLAYVLAPSIIERLLETLASLPENARRSMGALAIVIGMISLWLANLLGVHIAL